MATNHDEVDAHADAPDPSPTRQCSRCRATFPVDDTLLFTGEYEWWLCPTCSDSLIGKRAR